MLQLVTNWIDKLRVKRNISPIFGIRVVCVLSIFYSAYCLVPWASCVGTKNNKNKQNAVRSKTHKTNVSLSVAEILICHFGVRYI